jgi:hypothetical protein
MEETEEEVFSETPRTRYQRLELEVGQIENHIKEIQNETSKLLQENEILLEKLKPLDTFKQKKEEQESILKELTDLLQKRKMEYSQRKKTYTQVKIEKPLLERTLQKTIKKIQEQNEIMKKKDVEIKEYQNRLEFCQRRLDQQRQQKQETEHEI